MAVKHDCVVSAPVQTACFDTNLLELHIYDNKTEVIVFGPINSTGNAVSHLVPLTSNLHAHYQIKFEAFD